MRQKRKFTNKLLIFGIVFMLFSCSEDLYDEQINQRNFKTEVVPIRKIEKDFNFKQNFQKVTGKSFQSKLEKNNTAIMRGEFSTDYVIVDTLAHVASGEGLISYNFKIEYPSKPATDTIHNLVIHENNNTQISDYFITKNVVSAEKLTPVTIITSDETSRGIMDCFEWIEDPRFFRHITLYIDWECIEASGGSGSGGTNTGGVGGNNGGIGGDGGIGENGPGTGSNSSGTSWNGGGVLVSPIGGGGGGSPQTFPDTPCGRMQKKSSQTAFKQKIKELHKNTNYNKTYETGYYEKSDGSLNFMTGTPTNPTLKFVSGTTSFMHIHMNNTQTENEDGTVTTNLSVKMLSPADISALIGSASNALQAGLSPFDSYGIMLSNEGMFSVNLINTNVGMSQTLLAQLNYDYRIKVAKIFKETSANSPERKEALQKMLLSLLKEKGLGNEVALYEGIIESGLGQELPTINWIQKTLDANGNLVETPC